MISDVYIVIFGVTGDLALNKLLPALFDLHSKFYSSNASLRRLHIVGYGRKPLNGQTFSQYIAQSIYKSLSLTAERPDKHSTCNLSRDTVDGALKNFIHDCSYVQGDLTEKGIYHLRSVLDKEIKQLKTTDACREVEILYYSALPANLQETVAGLLHATDLSKMWPSKILVEKPFGADEKSAVALNKQLVKIFGERGVYRVDHYIAKDALVTLSEMRFELGLLEHSWNDNVIDHINILFHEKKTVAGRAGLYDALGVVRDVVQNHLMQVIAGLQAESATGRAALIASLRVVPKSVKLGQYFGYIKETGVAVGTTTPTYISFAAYSSKKQWQKTKIYVSVGKALRDAKTEIEIFFKKSSGNASGKNASGTKKQHAVVVPLASRLSSYHQPRDAYSRLLQKAIEGDMRYFASIGEVVASWRFVKRLEQEVKKNKVALRTYSVGSKDLA